MVGDHDGKCVGDKVGEHVGTLFVGDCVGDLDGLLVVGDNDG